MPKLKREARRTAARDRFRRKPRPRSAPAGDVRRHQRPDDAERPREGRRPAARHRAADSLHARTRRLRRQRRQAVHADAACAGAGGILSALQPGGLGAAAGARSAVATAAQEISSLAVLDGNEVVFIARGSPTRVFSAGIDIGYRLPAFCTSVGRVLLVAIVRRRTGRGARRDGPHAADAVHRDRQEALLKAIIADRAQGYSLVDREAEPGFRSISVPVRRYDGAIVAAINMGAHVDRVSAEEMVERFLPRLREAAASVKSMLV